MSQMTCLLYKQGRPTYHGFTGIIPSFRCSKVNGSMPSAPGFLSTTWPGQGFFQQLGHYHTQSCLMLPHILDRSLLYYVELSSYPYSL